MNIAQQAQLLMAQGLSCRAVAMYRKLIASEPSTENYLMLAELYAQQGLFDDAKEMHTKAITLNAAKACVLQNGRHLLIDDVVYPVTYDNHRLTF